MISALIATLAMPQTEKPPETVDALQKRMAQDSRKLRTYRDSWLLTTTTPGGKVQMKVLRSIDGERCSMMAMIGQTPVANLGSDGKTSFFALHNNSVVTYFKTGNAWYGKLPAIDPAKLSEGDFNINIEGAYDWIIRCRPELKLIGTQEALLDGDPARLVTGEARRPNSEGRVVLKMWFPKDSYVLARAEATVTTEAKQKISFTAIRDRIDRTAKFETEEFTLPKELVTGYRELPWNQVVPGFQN